MNNLVLAKIEENNLFYSDIKLLTYFQTDVIVNNLFRLYIEGIRLIE